MFIHDLCNFKTKQPIIGRPNPQEPPLETLQNSTKHDRNYHTFMSIILNLPSTYDLSHNLYPKTSQSRMSTFKTLKLFRMTSIMMMMHQMVKLGLSVSLREEYNVQFCLHSGNMAVVIVTYWISCLPKTWQGCDPL